MALWLGFLLDIHKRTMLNNLTDATDASFPKTLVKTNSVLNFKGLLVWPMSALLS